MRWFKNIKRSIDYLKIEKFTRRRRIDINDCADYYPVQYQDGVYYQDASADDSDDEAMEVKQIRRKSKRLYLVPNWDPLEEARSSEYYNEQFDQLAGEEPM
ncbi:hypothetical protein BZG36_04049 [Bifiguratus adelaidae]|uniref:Uncharacterized protein n=1 Tax=Bifiguratus adelaidae TaxID=1938954 RepID=A0A261XWQ6_9FUNG|nr:hypothetical protein BZG36_04049 [Bifiguratus adelaidae]